MQLRLPSWSVCCASALILFQCEEAFQTPDGRALDSRGVESSLFEPRCGRAGKQQNKNQENVV